MFFLYILQSLKRVLWDHVPKCFPNYHPNYLWVFIFRVAENTMQLYIYLIIRTHNPDNRTPSVLVLRSSSSQILPYIYGGTRYREMSRVLSSDLQRRRRGFLINIIIKFYYKMFFLCILWKRDLWDHVENVFNQIIYGFLFLELQRKAFYFWRRGHRGTMGSPKNWKLFLHFYKRYKL